MRGNGDLERSEERVRVQSIRGDGEGEVEMYRLGRRGFEREGRSGEEMKEAVEGSREKRERG